MRAVRLHARRRSTSARLPADAEGHRPSVRARASKVYDITFENVQAGERTSHLFRLANSARRLRRRHRRPVRARARLVHLRRRRPHVALQRQRERAEDADPVPDRAGSRESEQFERRDVQRVLRRVLDDRDQPGARARRARTADAEQRGSVGPYELQDFHLYYTLRFGYAPTKVAFLARWQRAGRATSTALARDRARWLGVVPAALLPDEPVQAQRHAERAEGRLGRLALAARRLARAVGRQRRRLAAQSRRSAEPLAAHSA